MAEDKKKAPVVVLGARGGTGRAIVDYLKETGHRVIAVARNANAGVVDGVEWAACDVTNEDSLRKVLKGSQGVVFAASASKGWHYSQGLTPRYVDYLGCQSVAKVAVEEGVPRVVIVSSAFVTRPYHPVALLLSTLFGRIMYWKRKGELAAIEQLKGTKTSYTIVRPGGLQDAPPKGKDWVRIGQGDNMGGAIPRRDVAMVTVEALFSAKAKDTVFEVVSLKAKPKPRKIEDLFTNLVPNDGSHDPQLPVDGDEL